MNVDILSLLTNAFLAVTKTKSTDLVDESFDLRKLERGIIDANLPIESILAEAAIIASRHNKISDARRVRDSLNFIISNRPINELTYTQKSSSEIMYLIPASIKESVLSANKAIELVHDLSALYGIEFFHILGMRNLSAFIGEIFGREVCRSNPRCFILNPNQDGYPDLCALTPEGKDYIKEHTINGESRRDKKLWSPYPYGGIEVKATCGNTPPASKTLKPIIGQSRLPILVSAEWKAHHQQTKILLGIFWDFIDGLPTVLAAFFRNDLDTTEGKLNKDWGAIIHPSEGGGRTTSVSIMKQGTNTNHGVKKMGQGWVVLPDNSDILNRICTTFSIVRE